MRRPLAAPLVVLLVAGAAPARPRDVPRLVVHDHAVSAKLDGVPLAAALTRLATQAGAELVGQPAEPRDVTLRMRRVPVDEALKRLLGAQSFTLTYDADGGLKRIRLGGVAVAAAPVQVVPAAGTGDPAADPARVAAQEAGRRVGQFLNSPDPVPVTGRLAQLLGTDEATMAQVMHVALKSEDRRVREQARRIMVEEMAADAEMRAALATTVNGLPDAALVAFLRGMAGVDAIELAQAFGRYGGSPDVAAAMRRAVDLMRAQPAGVPAPTR